MKKIIIMIIVALLSLGTFSMINAENNDMKSQKYSFSYQVYDVEARSERIKKLEEEKQNIRDKKIPVSIQEKTNERDVELDKKYESLFND